MTTESLVFRLLAILFPIFGIVAAGYFYARHHKPEMAVANRLNMDVFVPALVFAAMAGKSFDLASFGPLALGGFIVLASCGLLAWPIARLLGIQPKTLVPPMMFNNSGNIGLPLAVLAWGEAALPAAVILFMVENTLHFSFGARLLDPKTRLLTLWRVPVVFAAIFGLTVAFMVQTTASDRQPPRNDAPVLFVGFPVVTQGVALDPVFKLSGRRFNGIDLDFRGDFQVLEAIRA